MNQRKLRAFLDEIAARKLAILVTELDVDDDGGPRDAAMRDRAVADEARRFLDVALDNPATRTVLTWGLTDRYLDPPQSWRLKLSGWKARRLPYDSELQPKPLHAALAQAFRRPGVVKKSFPLTIRLLTIRQAAALRFLLICGGLAPGPRAGKAFKVHDLLPAHDRLRPGRGAGIPGRGFFPRCSAPVRP